MYKTIIVNAGDRYGRLTIVKELEPKPPHRVVECICDCGKSMVTVLNRLRTGNTKSCGCLHRESVIRIRKTHGESKSPEYGSWCEMVKRCCNKKNKKYADYGGRGIAVCEEWRHSFESFLNHVGKRPSAKHSLDRFPNVNGNYEPGNVRWANQTQQMRNLRRNVMVEYEGKIRLLVEVCEELHMPYNGVIQRRYRGVPDSELFLPMRSAKPSPESRPRQPHEARASVPEAEAPC